MNYRRIYELLIDRARDRKLDSYTESHHILPRCLGGDDSKTNLVDLTAREHFIAHLLLVKMYNNNLKLVKAVAMMCIGQTERKLTNRLYGKYRILFSISMSEAQSGDKNSQHGTRWIHNLTERKSKKIAKTEILPQGWIEGRMIKFDNIDEQKKKQHQKDLMNEIRRKEFEEKYNQWYELYKQVGFEKFAEMTGYDKSKPNLVQNFAKYVTNFKPQNGKKRG